MALDDKITALSAANVAAQSVFVQALAPARDVYVQQRQAFATLEDRWLENLCSDDARTAAKDGWQALVASRKALTDAATAAATARDAALAAAWTDIRSR